ncbi:DUF4233 domain-containing protein [Pseudonocardia acaciae]|uniref:DUF4233 domain-containing protein n=1 Tax=Pseudonocardia acaciae TaxID=551276 RepID=UPI00055BFE51|nr:DUF4233 domain-containing protein [Pseudonocardia acaciae]
MTQPDPWKGFRGVMAATLILESIVVLLTLLVVTKIGDNGGPLGVGIVLALAAAMIVTVRFLRRPWALKLAIALQLATMACGFLVFALGVLGLIFGLVWFALLMMRRDVAARMSRGELPGQNP